MMRARQRGFVLPLTVGAVLLLAMALAPILDGVGVAVDRVQRGRERFDATLALEEATAAAVLQVATQGGEADAEPAWDGRPYASGSVRLSLQDLRGLTPLDGATGPALQRLLIALGVEDDAAPRLVDAYFDYIDADDLARDGGGEREAYAAAGLAPPRNAPLATVAEAIGALGWRAQTSLWRDHALERAATVRGPGGFNPGIAPRAALMALDGVTGELADAILSARGSASQLLPSSAKTDPRSMIERRSGSVQMAIAAGGVARRSEFRVSALSAAGPWRVDWSIPVPVSSAGLPRTSDDLPVFPPLRIDSSRP